jgi:hypothetical protein
MRYAILSPWYFCIARYAKADSALLRHIQRVYTDHKEEDTRASSDWKPIASSEYTLLERLLVVTGVSNR